MTAGAPFEVEAALYRALANAVRLRILYCLDDAERTAGEIAVIIGLAQSPTSQHLSRLRSANLVTTRRNAQVVHYSLTPGTRGALGVLNDTLAGLNPDCQRPGSK